MGSDTDLVMELVEAASSCAESALSVWEFDFVDSVSENTVLSEKQREIVELIMKKLADD